MEVLLEQRIEAEALRRLSRYSQNLAYTRKYQGKFSKRTGVAAIVPPHTLPNQWAHHPHFDPRYCINHAKFLARGVWASLRKGSYYTDPTYRTVVTKPSGGFRCIDAFSIPDAVVAKIFLDNLRIRNSKIFSGSSFAYQINKAPLDAVLSLKDQIGHGSIFVSQYDFSTFFDSIRHEYIKDLLDHDGPFLTTRMERLVIEAVMTHSFKEQGGIKMSGKREVGIPQGNSISLFLANVAAHPLDKTLERLNGSFARFADDAVIINHSYEDALATSRAYQEFSRNSGVAINEKKSSGIRLLTEMPSEMASISGFDFLGYRYSRSGLAVGARGVTSIKRRCARIIYNNLLLHPKRTGKINPKRLGMGFVDWDLVTCINELRSYIYGARSQIAIDNYLGGSTDLKNISGAVSYFALVEDGEVFRELDGWLIDVLHRGYEKRRRLIHSILGKSQPEVSKAHLVGAKWYNFAKIPMEVSVPSFHTAWRAARKSWSRHGLGGVDNVGLGYSS